MKLALTPTQALSGDHLASDNPDARDAVFEDCQEYWHKPPSACKGIETVRRIHTAAYIRTNRENMLALFSLGRAERLHAHGRSPQEAADYRDKARFYLAWAKRIRNELEWIDERS